MVRVGGRLLGWATEEVAEVFAPTGVTPLPEAVPHLLGATFHRGRPLTVVDTASLVGEPPSAEPPRLLVRLAPPRGHLAFSLDTVEAVVPYNELDLRDEASGALWAGLYPWDEQWVSVLRGGPAAAELDRALADRAVREHPGRTSDGR